ncbi:hypothetical protein HPB49_026335 [Dermacentor silvarum]|nr:hypothetical protein HPB49_026335 [Dermacentor silvarum]
MVPSKLRKPPPKPPSPDPESEDDFDEEDEDYSDGDQDISQFLGDLGDDDIEQGTEHGGVQKRAVDSAANSQVSKKLKKSDLYKPPTAEELNNLKEVETLFHSNLFGLQDKPETVLKKVPLPLPSGLPRDPKCRFRFVPPKTVQVVGSHAFGGAVGPDAVVDLALEMPLFKESRFVPARSNLRASWFFKDNSTGTSDELPSPQYNASVLADMRMVANARFLAEKLAQAPALVDATRLLKVWLRKRHLDQGPGAFSGFEMTLYLVHLLMKRQLSPMMSSYQAARFVLLTLSRSDLTTEDITLCTEPVANQPSLEDFRANYPLVLVDAGGFLNVCASVSTEAYLRVKHEARLAITFLDSCSADSFEVLFVTPLPFERTFDCFVL